MNIFLLLKFDLALNAKLLCKFHSSLYSSDMKSDVSLLKTWHINVENGNLFSFSNSFHSKTQYRDDCLVLRSESTD